MENVIKFLTIMLILILSIIVSAQNNSKENHLNEGLEKSKTAYFNYSTEQFTEARTILEKAFYEDESDLLPLYYITLIDYKLLEMSMRSSGENLFDIYYETALKNADKLERDKNFSADGKILTAAIYMIKIATSPMSAVMLSPKIHSLLDDAQEIAPSKPYSYVIRGMMKYNTPGIFGGSYEDALKNFNYAAKLFEKDENKNSINPVWGYAETFVWIGRTQEKLDDHTAAAFAYRKALSIEPEYGWVKYSLLPELEKKMASK